MSLIGKVGKKNKKSIFSQFIIYIILILGAIATLYPLSIMITTGFKGPTDQTDLSFFPKYWSDHHELLEKYINEKYAGNLSLIASTRSHGKASPQLIQEYKHFLENLPQEYWSAGFGIAPAEVSSKLTLEYQKWLRKRYKSLSEVNQKYIEENANFQSILPPSEMLERKAWKPILGEKFSDWKRFKEQLPPEYRIPIQKRRMFQEFLRSKYKNQFELLPLKLSQKAKNFEEVNIPTSGEFLQDFLRNGLPERYAKVDVESLWAKKHQEPMPIAAYEADYVQKNIKSLKMGYTFKNYFYVIDYVLLHGHALINTVIFCSLAVMLQLIINPLAAYILSRYPIKATGKILIFLLATMAFPAEVTMIPSFLLLKNLGLLNTFAALVLPTAASGYMIFLLKGFFDSLPQEIYESGEIDGAKESTLLYKIALPLSKPVLGYVGLLAFMGAYSSFMYAFIVAQDQKMWTLMVWIYELQLHAPKAVMMAALAVVALPTILVFMFAQRIISKGIILPGEK